MQQDTFFRVILPSLGVILLLWLAFLLRNALVITFICYLIAAALSPAVEWFQHKKFPRGLSIAIFYAIFLATFSGIAGLCIQLLVTEGAGLLAHLPGYIRSVTDMFSSVPFFGQLALSTEQLTRTISANTYSLLSSTLSYIGTATNLLFSLLSVLILTFFMLLQSREIKETCLLLFKDEHKNEARIILEQLSTQLGAYVRGQLLVALTVGIMVWLGLQFIKVPYAPLLGLLASVFDVVPILGSIAASVLGIIVALANDPALAFWTLVVYLVANQIEQNFLSPLILGKAVGISTFWVLISIFFGSVLYGLAGLYLGIPVAVIIKIAFEHFYKKDGKSRQLAAGSI